METYLIYRSLTVAQRAGRILEQKRLWYSLTRLPKPRPGEGCGYALKIRGRDAEKAASALKGAGLAPLRAEVSDRQGQNREVAF